MACPADVAACCSCTFYETSQGKTCRILSFFLFNMLSHFFLFITLFSYDKPICLSTAICLCTPTIFSATLTISHCNIYCSHQHTVLHIKEYNNGSYMTFHPAVSHTQQHRKIWKESIRNTQNRTTMMIRQGLLFFLSCSKPSKLDVTQLWCIIKML